MQSLTLDGLLREAARGLAEAGVEGARAEARWLLGRTLGLTDAALLVRGAQPANSEDAARFRAVIERRAAREPFAYVVGQREFYGRTFTVNRHVLVPRPETETLVEEALRVLAAAHSGRPLVVDIGTGSGAIACTVALEAPDAEVLACDVSAEALQIAAANRVALGLEGRLRLVCGSLLSWLGRPADLVLANLPYLPTGRLPHLMPEVRDWEPHLALDGGADGLELIAALLADASRTVCPGGTILLELDPEQVESARALLPEARATVIRDLAGLDRVLRLDVRS
ncbi:MAG: peptide chain release factor N(5)-glutamine methyltransferase [Chloroflexi bacterium]|nr:peptide chain release factor N(5)-glutamine methyltransferase [Chloroflexota bacterium]